MSELLEPSLITPTDDELPPDASPTGDDFDLDDSEGLVVSLSPGRMALRRFRQHKVAMVFLVIFLFIALVVIFAPFTTRYAEIQRLPPINGRTTTSPPNGSAWFGTDSLNRDIYSRIIWGGRVSLFIGLAVAIFSSIVGTIVGALAGYRGGWIDDVLMRTTDLFLAFPTSF